MLSAPLAPKLIQPEFGSDVCCFPEYCEDPSDGFETEGYRVIVEVPADGVLEVAVPRIEGCQPPRIVDFHVCGGCIYVGYDAAAVIDPTTVVAQTGGAADPSPTPRSLILQDGSCVETLHFANPMSEPALVPLSYYC